MNRVGSNIDGREKPLMTFVGYSRNDGYAPSFEQRLRLTASSLARQAQKFALPVEFLMVEWNPPDDRPPLSTVLNGICSNTYFTCRVVTVPEKFHVGFRGACEKSLNPAQALNVGFRRARGQYVSPLSSDVVLTDAVFKHLKSSGLNTEHVYRIDRCDVDAVVLQCLEVDCNEVPEALLDEAVIHHHRPLDEDMVFHYGVLPLHTNGCGDFLLMSRAAWHQMRGMPDWTGVASLDIDSLALHAGVANGLTEVRLPGDCLVYKLSHGKMFRHKVAPYRPFLRHVAENTINLLVPNRPKRAMVRAFFDLPRRQVRGLKGHFPSMEKNFVKPVRQWEREEALVCFGGENWGLGLEAFEETLL